MVSAWIRRALTVANSFGEPTMTNELTLSADFAVARTSKTGKTSYRGILGVITSGNAAERAKLAQLAIVTMIENNNFRHLMREVTRVFPVSAIKSAPNVSFKKGKGAEPDALYFIEKLGDGKFQLELFEVGSPNKATSHQYAKAILAVTAGKELKGEKRLYAVALQAMLDAEAARLEEAAEQARIEAAALATSQS